MRVIVTGGAGHLGRAVVRLLSTSHDVAIIDRVHSDEAAASVHQALVSDLASPELAANAIQQAVDCLDGVDALVHLTGGFEWVQIHRSTIEQWRSLFSINVETAVATILGTIPFLSKGGSIVCVGAASANSAGVGLAPYAAAKSGVARLVEALSVELKPDKIRVNAILPLIIDTPQNRRDMPDVDPDNWTSPEAIADVVGFLISDNARAINGALLPVTN